MSNSETKDYSVDYLNVINEFNSKGKILVTGVFDQNMADFSIRQLRAATEASVSMGLDHSMFVIDSQGGSTLALQRFVSYFEFFRPSTDFKYLGYVSGEGYSAAFELLQYCDWRVAHSGASLWAHYGKMSIGNQDLSLLSENHHSALAFERSRIKETVRVYSKRSHLPEKQVHQILKNDLPMTASQALNYGFIDEIVDNTPSKSIRPEFSLKF